MVSFEKEIMILRSKLGEEGQYHFDRCLSRKCLARPVGVEGSVAVEAVAGSTAMPSQA